jgi:pyruvate formate lyase activating enzyme
MNPSLDAVSSPVTCTLCPHACRLSEGRIGRCRVRICRDGVIRPLHYGRVSALALDPIEKKPLYHFHPGKRIFSVGGFGCNLNCPFCQNAAISMSSGGAPAEHHGYRDKTAAELVEQAVRLQTEGNIGLAFTYNEPLVGLEFVRETFFLARAAGLETVLVTNGCFRASAIQSILPLTTAWNIDLKAFSEEEYRMLGGDFETVRATIRQVAGRAHLEVTTLVVPGFNDSLTALEELVDWLAGIDPGIPFHLSRFFPRHHMTDRLPTDVALLTRMKNVAQGSLRHVYLGNC